jgi:hypothetical protein
LVCAIGTLTSCAHDPQPDCRKLIDASQRVVSQFDTNGDGMLSGSEWSGYETLLRQRQLKIDKEYNTVSSPDDVTRMFGELDKDGNGYVTAAELLNGLCVDELKVHPTK